MIIEQAAEGTRVLIVEDERIVALNLKQRLMKQGYNVCALATSGATALHEITKERPDVVLMDINIEGDIDGIETVSRIPPEFQTPVIYLTAYSEQATLDRARETKPYGYLLKPFSERELHATIQMVLARRQADVAARETERRLEQLVADRTAALIVANEELKKQIAQRQEAEHALAQAQKIEAIGHLTGGIAHDFNNLLQGIGGSLSLLKRRIAQKRFDDTDKFIDGAIESTNRAAGLTHRLLAFSRRQPLSPKPVACNDLLTGMHDMLVRTMGEAIDIKLAPGDALWSTMCDANQLESAVLNLAINARDAMPRGGTLTMTTSNVTLNEAAAAAHPGLTAGEYVCVAVSDVGGGMSKEVADRAFDPFFTTKPIGQGTGLGLSMVYGFARQSGGAAVIDSAMGRGTTVKIYLPRFDGQVPAEAPADKLDATKPSTRADDKVVLVVEDESTVRSLVLEVLKDLGYRTLHAHDGTSGLDILKSGARIDLLVTDIGLPGLNGRQLADSARALRPALKILFMTGYAENTTLPNSFLESGMSMMTKPFTIEALAERIQAMMA
jgi:signal transduction histidine kinase